MSILVVDDNTLLLSKVVRSLLLAEYCVRSATSMGEARAAMQQQMPRVLCLDLNLPDGDGLDLLQELREKGLSIPVVVISGCQSEDNRKRAERLGAAGFLAKPFSLETLHRLLDKLLGSATPAALADAAAADGSPDWGYLDPQRLRRAVPRTCPALAVSLPATAFPGPATWYWHGSTGCVCMVVSSYPADAVPHCFPAMSTSVAMPTVTRRTNSRQKSPKTCHPATWWEPGA
jgi:DNA-binding response OmpR family regulator